MELESPHTMSSCIENIDESNSSRSQSMPTVSLVTAIKEEYDDPTCDDVTQEQKLIVVALPSFKEENVEPEEEEGSDTADTLEDSTNMCETYLTDDDNNQIMKKFYAEGKRYQCEICGNNYKRAFSLREHKWTHTGEKPFSCMVCDQKFVSNSNLKKHNLIHTGERPYPCNICGKSFKIRHDLNVHLRFHDGVNTELAGNSDQACGYSLMEHQSTHSGEKPFICKICGKIFVSNSSLKAHELIHSGGSPHGCGICGKNFTTRSYLIAHMRVHAGVKPYVCKICNAKFAESRFLENHTKLHFIADSPLTTALPRVPVERFWCSVCSKNFSNEESLFEHNIVHIGVHPLSCRLCGDNFSSDNILRAHLKIHENSQQPVVAVQQGISDVPCYIVQYSSVMQTNEFTTINVKPDLLSLTTVDVEPDLRNLTTIDVKPDLRSLTTIDFKPDLHSPPDEETVVDTKPNIDNQLDDSDAPTKINVREECKEESTSCTKCNKHFKNPFGKKIHDVRVHDDLSCFVCGKTFKFAGALRKHVRSHSKVPHGICNCVICDPTRTNVV